jgi:lipoate-protein ligase A
MYGGLWVKTRVSEETWRLLDIEYDDPYMNLAVEEVIPRMVGRGVAPNTVRFWRNSNAAIIGRFQNKESEVNLDATRRYGTTVVRRFTGGGAVYHDSGNLNYAISVSKNHSLVADDIIKIYRIFSKGVIRGINILGLNAEFKPPNMIQVNNKKISGMASSLNWQVIFCHGTLLVNTDLRILSEVLDTRSYESKSLIPSIPSEVTTLQDQLNRRLSTTEAKEAITKGFEEIYRVALLSGKLTREEEELAHELYETKYSTDEWNSKQ